MFFRRVRKTASVGKTEEVLSTLRGKNCREANVDIRNETWQNVCDAVKSKAKAMKKTELLKTR